MRAPAPLATLDLRTPFLFSRPLELPAGTVIPGVAADAAIALLPAHD